MIVLEKNGIEKEVPTGFSWTSVFFGVFLPAYRGDVKGFIVQLAMAFLTSGISWFFVPFRYNHIYLDRLVSSGWTLKKID